jgi:hypothetical protein
MVRMRLAELVIILDLTVDVPVTVMEKFPDGAEGPTATLSRVVAEGPVRMRVDDASVAFTLAGTPETERETVPVKPLREKTVILDESTPGT